MEQTQKSLKLSSIFVLLFAGLSMVEIVAELLFGEINSAVIPEGAPENILMITKIILLAVSLLFLLPQLYIGIKGLKIAKCPDSSKGHIIWAAILLTFSVLNLIDSIMGFIKNGSIVDSSVDVFGILLNVIIYFEYLMYARAIQKKN